MPDFLWRRDESPAQRLAMAPLTLLEGLYRLGVRLDRGAYEWGLRKRVQLPARVVSIGNLTVGGSGKTPLVAWLARQLHAQGRKVAVLSRGVRGQRSGQVNVVSDGERVLLSPAQVGDEPVLLAGEAPGVPVLAGRNRAALGYRAAALFGAELLLLDDGFQHYRVARDIDLLCIDATTQLGNGHVLPRGPLREPAAGLRRAHAIVWTRAPELYESFAPDAWLPLPSDVPQFAVRMEPRCLRPLGGGEPAPLESLRGRRVGLLCAIARPDRLLAQIQALGAEVAQLKSFPDHHLYRRADLDALDPELPWLTTAKDAVKLPHSWLGRAPIEVLEEEVRPVPPGGLERWVVERLDATAPARSPA